MSDEEKIKHDVRQPSRSVETLEEFEALLVAYKKSSPAKYAFKEDNGEFDRKRAELGGNKVKKPKVVKEAEEPEPEKEEKKPKERKKRKE